ncbi:hypothetical protein CCR94_15065 [Rhodoblastus sphagnicola]|uniref:Uncharacterized protein n=1 Tax=Rhodoblastus sphagnicola TaxID=333368 RepID=A0A2S6N4L2_9HYPH|nr:esterase-like activity of phytase family protein [Rhodoblastus sphagnicola]MBB4196373.1 uncharacterized protein YhjY with autotransporter beta-barrel domain [Rhodoblastus sphagnicola]PPQ29538.1 hypothetical protein CCR94_15065 [Rhodoblastus sphagnicola]
MTWKVSADFKAALFSGVAFLVLPPVAAGADPLVYKTPNVISVAGSTSATLNGTTVVNQGLQGVARLSATSTYDFAGDTFGAFSSLAIDLSSWRKTATGYTGAMFALPDRGPNGVGSVTFSDYAARVNILSMAFTPYTSGAALPVSEASQHQLQLTMNGGFFLRDFNGNVTTGLDASGATVQNGITLPSPASGVAAGKISIDSEGLRFLNNGNFYVSDEYGANVYYFDKTGNLLGVITPPAALIPRNSLGQIAYTSLTDAATGRRLNQGLEGLAITPDQKKLVTLLQSAAMQDSTSSQNTRANTRLMIYDITQSKTPSTPIADYVLQLPIYNSTGGGAAANRTAAQSELLALNDTQFLVLSRDGNGLGQANLNPVFKSVLLIDTSAATNIAGSVYETTTTPLSPSGKLASAIIPVQQVDVLNMLNTAQLGKFGININNTSPTRLTLTEKWEGMALAPVLEQGKPQDFFLFIGNDNDFLSTTCVTSGVSCAQAVNSDAMVLIYRMTLPTYVDPQYLAWMIGTGPLALAAVQQSGLALADINSGNIAAQLNANRRAGRSAAGTFTPWIMGAFGYADSANFIGATGETGSRNGFQGSVGLDYSFSPSLTVGGAVGLGKINAHGSFSHKADGVDFSLYSRVIREGFFAQAGYSIGHANFDSINRPAAYGLTATGKTSGDLQAFFLEAGYDFDLGAVKVGPVGGYALQWARISGYTETGAAGGNIAMPQTIASSQTLMAGVEAFGQFFDVTPFARLTYNHDFDAATRYATLKLASAQAAMASATVAIPRSALNYGEMGVGVQGKIGAGVWSVGYSAQLAEGGHFSNAARVGYSHAF